MKVVSALVFLAMAAYLGFSLYQRTTDPVQTALAVTATMTDSASMSGLVVRDELVISSEAQYIDVTAEEGEKVSVGQEVAVIYSSEEALSRAERLDELSREIESVKAALSGARGAVSAGDRETSIQEALTAMSASLRSDAMRAVDTRQSTLASLLFRREVSDATEDYLVELELSYRDLLATSSGDTKPITASQSGTFSGVVDGYEGVSPAYVQDLTPAELREIIAADRTVDDNAVGKLALSFDWYYAAILGEDDASRLEVGSTARLSFGRYYGDHLTAKVVAVGNSEQGECLVLFRLDHAFTEMLAVRAVSAELIYSEYEGLRVPLKGLYRYYAGYLSDEDGARLTEGGRVTLSLGGEEIVATVSEVGSARRYGDLPAGVEAGGEFDTRPSRRLAVFVWPWDAESAQPDTSAGGGTVTLSDGRTSMPMANYYEYDPETDRLCVFTMTGLQAERKKVELVFAGEEYCLLRSEGDDALREGNEVIVQAKNLHNGKVFR